MRITYLHQYFNTPEMSGGTRSYEMARKLVAMGHEVNMITSWRENDGKTDWFETEEAGIHVHWIPVPYSNKMGFYERLRAFTKFAVYSSLKAIQLKSDIIFATSTPLTIAIPGVIASKINHIPMVFEVRDLWPEVPILLGVLKNPCLKSLAWRLERFAYSNSKKIVALSEKMKKDIIKKVFSNKEVFLIPNGSDLEFFKKDYSKGVIFRKQQSIDLNKIVIGYTGTLGEVNGIDYIVELASILQNDNKFLFLIVGDGKEKEKIESLALQKQCLDKNLLILPKVPKSQVPKILSATDIAISTVKPLSILEADSANKVFDGLAAGCCIAVNHGGSLTKILEENGAGIQLSTEPITAAKQLQKFADTQGAIEKAGQNARKLAETKFSRDDLAKQLEQVLLSAAGNK